MRLIDADAMNEKLFYKQLGGKDTLITAECAFNMINEQPTVEAKPVVHGEWDKTFRYMRENINTGKLEPVYSCDCPICTYHTGNQGVRFNFCPNCGADMRGVKNE